MQVHVQPATDIILPADAVNRQTGPARLRRRVLLVHAIGELAYWCTLILLMLVAETGFGVLRLVSSVLLSFFVIPVAVGWAGWIAAAAHEHRRRDGGDLRRQPPVVRCGGLAI